MAIFWTQFMGLDLWYSLLLIIVQVWDAINAPPIGSTIDSDRRQRRHAVHRSEPGLQPGQEDHCQDDG